MRKPRTNYTPPEKVSFSGCHLIDRVPVSDLSATSTGSRRPCSTPGKNCSSRTVPLLPSERAGLLEQSNLRTTAALREKLQPQERRGRRGIDGRTYPLKKSLGPLDCRLGSHDVRDAIVE